ncbi:MAG: FHA domain-containing protein [Oscillospiraceae bacterium]|nr:FHA domain-containing protein [Oscillospiraceae bacterium]
MAEIEYYTRYLLCALAIAVLINCAISLLRLRPKKKVYAIFRDLATNEEYEMTCYETSVGRARNTDIRFKLPSVSRAHAVVALRKDGFYVFDTDSKQGVYVNGEKIDKKAKLSHGDTIAFGMAIMKFYVAHEATGDIKNTENLAPVQKNYTLTDIVSGGEFSLEGDYATVGREAGSKIEITAPNISRKQAVFTNENGVWYIHNLSRTTPTLLNGEVLMKPTALNAGDVIKFGDFAFLFEEKE